MHRILIVEDDQDVALILRAYFEDAGFVVMHASLVQEGISILEREKPDLIVLDLNLPGENGYTLLEHLKQRHDTPVLILSARKRDEERLEGLHRGADDYVSKPFNPNEVVARVNAIIRRSQGLNRNPVTRLSSVAIDQESQSAWVESGAARQTLKLTPAEFSILQTLMLAPHKAFTRFDLIERCFPDSPTLERTVDSHISRLRKKIADSGGPSEFIDAVRGYGYKVG